MRYPARMGLWMEHVGGSPANVALGLGRLGVPVRLQTALGQDARGERIAAYLAASGVRVDPSSWSLPQTSTAFAHIGPDGAAEYDFHLDWVLSGPPTLAGERVVHVGSVAAFLEPGATTLEKFLTDSPHRTRITFDPNIRPALVGDHAAAVDRVRRIARMASLVKLSDEDAAWLYPGEPTEQVFDRFLSLGVETVAITLGGSGAALASQSARAHVPAPAVKVVDTVGAGDTFMAALIDAILSQGRGAIDEHRCVGWVSMQQRQQRSPCNAPAPTCPLAVSLRLQRRFRMSRSAMARMMVPAGSA